MDSFIRAYHEKLIQSEDVISILLVDNRDKCSSLLGGTCFFSYVILNCAKPQWETKQYQYQEYDLIEQRMSQWQVEQWAIYGPDETVAPFLQDAEIIFDPFHYMVAMKERLSRLSTQAMKLKMCEEYSCFLKHYLEAKELLQFERVYDAYFSVLNTLNGWARLVLCEAGEFVDINIWKKVKQIDPAIYKLYEELIAGPESLEKRIELIMLPIEFTILSKMKTSTKFLVDILQSHQRPWLYSELKDHPDVVKAKIDLPLLLNKMVKRSLVLEVYIKQSDDILQEKAYLLVGY